MVYCELIFLVYIYGNFYLWVVVFLEKFLLNDYF